MWGQREQQRERIGLGASGRHLCFAVGAITLALSGCGAAGDGQAQILQVAPAAPDPATATPTPDPAATPAAPEESSEAIRAVTEALNAISAQTPEPDAEALRDALGASGADPTEVEVSIDTTPTGLEVDAMTGAVPVGEWCIFGHIRDGIATVTQLPVLSDGRCFIGDQR